MTANDTDLLAELIRRKRDCLARLLKMSMKQFELVQEGGMTELLDVLALKQRTLFDLQRVERALDPYRDQDPAGRPWPSDEARRKTAAHLDDCERLLGAIVAQEKQSERELTLRRDQTATQLQGAHVASQARGAYTAQSQAVAHQLDVSTDR